ncbi:MBL fold metallo-hydrolase [Candidatus Microgenomates bacterium]|nr:MBL fold metallo-hydrolase [Candidatus Microgenomates bacterium]
MRITFFGAAGRVTGSNYILETGGKKIMIDCGLFQGNIDAEKKNHEPFAYNVPEVDAVIITHSHIDHIGRVPKLIKEGFYGTIYSTGPTKELSHIFLADELKIMKSDLQATGAPLLWEEEHLEKTISLWRTFEYHKPFAIGEAMVEFFDAGHILGSAIVRITCEGKSIVFSGDLGNPPTPIVAATESPKIADYIVTESTYGDRLHEKKADSKLMLERAIEDTFTRKGVLLIPAFAMERTQELLFEINELVEHNRIPHTSVFIDSPLAIKATEIYKKYQAYFNQTTKDIISSGDDIFRFPRLTMSRTSEESKQILNVPTPKMVIAGSGMSTGGRILFHERNYLSDPSTIMLFVGYQVRGTLGRRIKDGEKEVRVLGEDVAINAEIRAIEGYSAHGDQNQLFNWTASMCNTTHKPHKVFITHGEQIPAETLGKRFQEELGLTIEIPEEKDSFDL